MKGLQHLRMRKKIEIEGDTEEGCGRRKKELVPLVERME